MTPKPTGLADQVSEIVSTTIKRVREIFEAELPVAAPIAPTRKARDDFYFDVI
jgi:hypothetical protein